MRLRVPVTLVQVPMDVEWDADTANNGDDKTSHSDDEMGVHEAILPFDSVACDHILAEKLGLEHNSLTVFTKASRFSVRPLVEGRLVDGFRTET
jgi:hypothetical protein